MKILFTASECVPFVKTGGLADVVGALAPVLAAQGDEPLRPPTAGTTPFRGGFVRKRCQPKAD